METGLTINKLSNCLRRRGAAIQRSAGISGAQGAVLEFILLESMHGSVCQRDIEREFGLRPSTATGMLKSLEAQQLILRITDRQDARRKNIVFTPQAEALREALTKELERTEEVLLQGLTANEKAQFQRISAKMLKNLTRDVQ